MIFFLIQKACFFHVPRHFSCLKTPNLSFSCLVQMEGVWIHTVGLRAPVFSLLILELSTSLQVVLLKSFQGHGHGWSSGEGHVQVPVWRTQYYKYLSGQQRQPIFSYPQLLLRVLCQEAEGVAPGFYRCPASADVRPQSGMLAPSSVALPATILSYRETPRSSVFKCCSH